MAKVKVTMKPREIRAFDGEPFEVRAAPDAPTRIEGYAVVFGKPSNGEMIKRGAFAATLKTGRDIKAYWSHDSSKPLGRIGNGTLKLEEDSYGLRAEIVPNAATSWGKDALASVERGDVTGMSFAFVPVVEESALIDGEHIRVLKEVALFEVSPVASPWYPDTTAEAREDETETEAETAASLPDEPMEAKSTDAIAQSDLRRERMLRLAEQETVQWTLTQSWRNAPG